MGSTRLPFYLYEIDPEKEKSSAPKGLKTPDVAGSYGITVKKWTQQPEFKS